MELEEREAEEIMCLSRSHWHKGSRSDPGETNLGFEGNQEDKIPLLEKALELQKTRERPN